MSMSAHIRFETKLITPACKPTTLRHSESKVSLNIASSYVMLVHLTWEAVEKPTNWSFFEASRLNSPKLGVKFFDRLMD